MELNLTPVQHSVLRELLPKNAQQKTVLETSLVNRLSRGGMSEGDVKAAVSFLGGTPYLRFVHVRGKAMMYIPLHLVDTVRALLKR